MEEYLLVFERDDGNLGIIRVSGTFEQVSHLVGLEMEQDGSIRCFISKLVKIVELVEKEDGTQN